MSSNKLAQLGCAVALQGLILLDVTIYLSGQDSIISQAMFPGSSMGLIAFPVLATVICFCVCRWLYPFPRLGGLIIASCILATEVLVCNTVYRSFAARSFDDAQSIVLGFLRNPNSFKASYGIGVDEKYVKSLKQEVVNLFPLQSLKRYQSYEFIVQPRNGRALSVQIRGRGDLLKIFVHREEQPSQKLAQDKHLEDFEVPLLDVSLE